MESQEEIYYAISEYHDKPRHAYIRPLSSFNYMTMEYDGNYADEELVDEEVFTYENENETTYMKNYIKKMDEKIFYVFGILETDTDEHLKKVFQFFGKIHEIIRDNNNLTAIIKFEKLYQHEFTVKFRERMIKKHNEKSNAFCSSSCLIYTRWKPEEVSNQDHYWENFVETHKEVEEIRFYDVYYMDPIPNYEETCKLYEVLMKNQAYIIKRLQEIVREEPVDFSYMDYYYPL